MAWSLWVTMPSEGFTANPSDGRVTLFWNWKANCTPSDGMVTQSDQTANEPIKLKSILKFHKFLGTFYSPSGHSSLPRSVTQSDQTANKPIKLKSILKFHKFLGTFYSPSGHSSLPRSVTQSDQTANKPIKLKSILKFHKFLGTFYSPSGHPFIPRPVTHLFPVRSLISFSVRSLISFPVRSLLYSPSGHSFIPRPVTHFIPRPVTHLFPVRSLIYSPSGHSFIPRPVTHLFPVRSLLNFLFKWGGPFKMYYFIGNVCKTTSAKLHQLAGKATLLAIPKTKSAIANEGPSACQSLSWKEACQSLSLQRWYCIQGLSWLAHFV